MKQVYIIETKADETVQSIAFLNEHSAKNWWSRTIKTLNTKYANKQLYHVVDMSEKSEPEYEVTASEDNEDIIFEMYMYSVELYEGDLR